MQYIYGLFEKYAELKILRFLLLGGHALHLKEISRQAKTSPATVSKLMKGLEKDGLIERKIIGNTHVFKMKDESPIVKHLKVLINISIIMENKLIEQILGIDSNVASIALYGSFADGSNDEKSDIDILVMAETNSKFDSATRNFEKKTGKTTNIETFSILSWKKCKEKNRAFYDSVKSNHIVLHGGELF